MRTYNHEFWKTVKTEEDLKRHLVANATSFRFDSEAEKAFSKDLEDGFTRLLEMAAEKAFDKINDIQRKSGHYDNSAQAVRDCILSMRK